MKYYLGLFTMTIGLMVSAQSLKLPRLFADRMVLQREQPIRFWGWSAPGDVVVIEIDGFEVAAKTDEQGNWECLYPAHTAGGPFKVKIASDEAITLEDVYFGDVWIAGGQSNMEWVVGGQIDNMEKELQDAEYPQIRFFKVNNQISPEKLADLPSGEWKVASADNVKDFSAVAWFFAKRNHLEKNVPVAIISSNWGGTPAEAWVSSERLLSVKGYEERAAEMLDSKTDWNAVIEANNKRGEVKYQRVQDTVVFLKYGAHNIDFDDSKWSEVQLPNKEPLTDFVWLRKSFDYPNRKSAQLTFGDLDKFAAVFINGKQVHHKSWADPIDPVIELESGLLHNGKNVIAVRVAEDWDNLVTFGRSGKMLVKSGKKTINLEGAWKFSNTVEPPMPEVRRYEHSPGMLFNAMIHPIAGYTIKGTIWYQGESNVVEASLYQELFEALIEEWRMYWRQGRFPFLYAQLANWQQRYDYPTESGWAQLQEAQTQTLALENTGMACIIDIGDAEDIHPRNKQDVGYRLWLTARKVAFGEELVYSGPMYKAHKIEGGKVYIDYNHVGSGLKVKGESLKGFALAGEDKVFKWAEAIVGSDNQVILSSEEVPDPVYVRYAWADNPECNLYNEEGLPAVPFRTDR